MKQFLISTLLCVLSFFSYSQNGGQNAENNVVKVEYLGYSSGSHVFRVHNKQNCQVTIRTKVDNEMDVDNPTPANDSFYVNVPRLTNGATKFRAKSETACISNPDKGWVEIETMVALNLVEGNNITIVRGPNKLDLSINRGILKSSYGSVNYIEHIRIYSIMGNVKYDEVTFARRMNITDLNNYLKTGLNIIEVIIVDDNNPDRFIFKYMK